MSGPAGSLRVLIIEDERIISDFIEDVLAGTSHQVVGVAHTGDEGLRLAGEARPDVALVDITLKGGMNGLEAAGELRDRHHVRVVFVTGLADPETRARARAVSPDGFLKKPFLPKDLITILDGLQRD